MKMQVFTHGDLDGVGSALVLSKAFSEKAEEMNIEYCNYDDIDERIDIFLYKNAETYVAEGHKLFITDICPSKETCEKLEAFNKHKGGLDVMLFDHHVTRKWVSNYSWSVFNDSFCATAILADWALNSNLIPFDQKLKDFCKSVDAWDMWKLEDKLRLRGERLNALAHFLGLKEFLLKFMRDIEADLGEFETLVDYLFKNRQRKVEQIIKKQLYDNPRRMDNFGDTYMVLFADEFISELGEAVLSDPDSKDLQYVVIVNPINNTVSLRSRQSQDVDVAAIAQKCRGGGHKHASGFPFAITRPLEEKIYHLLDRIE